MSPKNKTILITGNHHTPAHELIRQLKKDLDVDWNIFFISHLYPTETHLSQSIIPELKPKHFFSLHGGKYHRQSIIKTILDVPRTINTFIQALNIITHIKPDIVISFGGYISVPVIIAATLKHIPSITHEQTSTLSLSTKINSLFCHKVALSFPQKHAPSKFVVTGNLLRSSIYRSLPSTQFNHHLKPFIYITGGNQGSDFINQLTQKIAPTLISKYTLIHQTGHKQISINHPKVIQQNYINPNQIGFILQHASLIISRSGANTCQEIVALRKKSILIPLPISQQQEQLLNAQWVKKTQPKITFVFKQSQVTTNRIIKAINRLDRIPPTPIQSQKINYQLLKLIHELV